MIKRSLSLLALLYCLLWSVHPCDAQSAERQVAQSLVRTIEMQTCCICHLLMIVAKKSGRCSCSCTERASAETTLS